MIYSFDNLLHTVWSDQVWNLPNLANFQFGAAVIDLEQSIFFNINFTAKDKDRTIDNILAPKPDITNDNEFKNKLQRIVNWQ